MLFNNNSIYNNLIKKINIEIKLKIVIKFYEYYNINKPSLK